MPSTSPETFPKTFPETFPNTPLGIDTTLCSAEVAFLMEKYYICDNQTTNAMKEAGYVYILTNPSFKEDWVKIGKSSRPVDIRSKELDNTAVPLPFEIYATLKTTKYSEAEKLIHSSIERFTNLRIRNNREFFNVSPTNALAIFKDVAQLLDDAEIEEVYKQRNNYVISPSDTLHNEDEIFNANVAVREDIINAIKQVIGPKHQIKNKFLIRHFKAYSTISYEKNYLWFVRIYLAVSKILCK